MLLVDDRLIPVAGLNILPPASHGGPGWCQLHPGDYAPRQTPWVRQIIVHSTGGKWPQRVIPGGGRPGHAEEIADMWRGADRGGGGRVHSAAQLLVDFDGTIACLCDLLKCAAYHAEASNPWSVGIELCTHPDGSIQETTLKAGAKLIDALCWPVFPIPRQMPRGLYKNQPLSRMEMPTPTRQNPNGRRQLGGPECVGVFGHRDNTSERGRGDPGDAIFAELTVLGFEAWDFESREDLLVGKERQAKLNARGARLVVDGQVGARSLLAAENQGFARWADVRH
jgi:hypothetical protein